MQCPAPGCFKTFHPECARRYKLQMEYGHPDPPFWRIYCEQHADIEITKRLRELPKLYYEPVVKFMRQLNKQVDMCGNSQATAAPGQPIPRKINFKANASAINEVANKDKIIDAYVRSYIISEKIKTFYIELHKAEGPEYSVSHINIPPCCSEETMLDKRCPDHR